MVETRWEVGEKAAVVLDVFVRRIMGGSVDGLVGVVVGSSSVVVWLSLADGDLWLLLKIVRVASLKTR